MSINAIVDYVIHHEDGSGKLVLTGEERGQQELCFDSSPYDITALNGLQIWGGSSSIMHGETEIAKRVGYTQIEFTVESVSRVVAREHRRRAAKEAR